mmetsp:Transcript_14390/g.21569  ORF Transcript_14390/g.21569 Transcript_14390/m.21569 type:complete len:185 (-) Transcript_14390:2288-2842(-)
MSIASDAEFNTDEILELTADEVVKPGGRPELTDEVELNPGGRLDSMDSVELNPGGRLVVVALSPDEKLEFRDDEEPKPGGRLELPDDVEFNAGERLESTGEEFSPSERLELLDGPHPNPNAKSGPSPPKEFPLLKKLVSELFDTGTWLEARIVPIGAMDEAGVDENRDDVLGCCGMPLEGASSS